jgi:hypothetical protein
VRYTTKQRGGIVRGARHDNEFDTLHQEELIRQLSKSS